MKDLSKIDLMLLGMLMRRPMHGYELVDELSGPYMSIWVKVGRASVYYALTRLGKSELVSKHSERQSGKPERTVYSITDEGRKAFFSRAEVALGGQPVSMDEFDIALYYANQLEPGVTASRYLARSRSLRETLSIIDGRLADARRRGEVAIVTVLERRRALAQAELEFLKRIPELRAGVTPQGTERGPGAEILEPAPLHEIVRNLAAAARSGVLWAFAENRLIGFHFKDGAMTGIVPAAKVPVDDALRQAFSVTDGRFAFSQPTALHQRMLPVDGHAATILRGCRLAAPSAAGTQMPADPEVVFDLRSGYEYETVGIDLKDDERRLLGEVDGVRTFRDLGRHLGWDVNGVIRTMFPLWAVGWAVRSDEGKRHLVLAISTYLQFLSEAISLIAGEETVGLIYDDVSFAAVETALPDFWHPYDRRSVATRFAGDRLTVETQAKTYTSLVGKSARSRLGDAFVSEILGGVAQRIPDEHGTILSDLRILSNSESERHKGERP